MLTIEKVIIGGETFDVVRVIGYATHDDYKWLNENGWCTEPFMVGNDFWFCKPEMLVTESVMSFVNACDKTKDWPNTVKHVCPKCGYVDEDDYAHGM